MLLPALIALASGLSLALVLSCDAQPQSRKAQPIKIERFTVSNVEVSLHYFDQRLVPLDAQIKAVVGQAFNEAVKLFGGLPKDLSGADYRQFQVDLRYFSNLNMSLGAESKINSLCVFQSPRIGNP